MTRKLFIAALIVLGSLPAMSQSNCTVPLSPVLTSVSVQPLSFRTEFRWIPAETENIAGYIIYIFSGGDGTAIDTLWDPAATSHVISNTAPRYSSVSYVVAAHRLSAVPGLPGCTSPLSNSIATIFCEASIDTCNKKLSIEWNPYVAKDRSVVSYTVMMSHNGAPWEKAAEAGPESNILVLESFETDASYCFYVKAELDDGSSSTSNSTCLSTSMQRPPAWISPGSSSFQGDNTFNLSFDIDPLSELRNFILEKSSDGGSTWQTIATLSPVDSKVTAADINAGKDKVALYRLSALNACNIPVRSSNIASNIALTVSKEGNMLNLKWNRYRQWLAPVAGYRLFLDTGSGYMERETISSADSTISINYRDIMYEVSGDRICMYIIADEELNQYGLSGSSVSSTACTEPSVLITVPNLFTPDGDLLNETFRPVLSFIPSAYHLVVSDQHGLVVFESKDYTEAWDGAAGRSRGSNDVFLWVLKVLTPEGDMIVRKGTVTILRKH